MHNLIYKIIFISILLSLFSCDKSETSLDPKINFSTASFTYSSFVGGQMGNVDGKLKDAKFNTPSAMAIDSKDNIYVADRFNLTIRIISPDGEVKTIKGTDNKPILTGSLTNGLVVDEAGNIYATSENQVIKITPMGEKSIVCGSGGTAFSDGVGTKASFYRPEGIVFRNNELVIADLGNYAIRKVNLSDKNVTTYAGIPKTPGSKDGTLKESSFNAPAGLTFDGQGILYITESYYSNVRKITSDGKVSTFVGGNFGGDEDGIGVKAVFNNPRGICASKDGYLFVADNFNKSVRKVSPDGSVKTIYRSSNTSDAFGIVMDSKGNLFISEPKTHSISKLTRK
jgi:sugar lactone lactonase YvrE